MTYEERDVDQRRITTLNIAVACVVCVVLGSMAVFYWTFASPVQTNVVPPLHFSQEENAGSVSQK